ncbi:MAG TPA: class I SAM-dependent methyltransferase [Fibrobacteria bacterium]|nr:class I SAM-dependent methyltransferase [Fibrobacteria bacterium]HOX51406.1 class I SAM-dependent methyltransferase [Fibrobacteria bacterium]
MERPYQALSARYDEVMEHVDHAAWARYVERIWKRHRHTPARILETGAGTCRMVPHLDREDRWLVASDLSVPMLEQGSIRISRRVACDFRELPFADGSFDSILCLYDAINYCLFPSDLDRYFAEAARVLSPGGLLVADITTATNSRRHFQESTSHEVLSGTHVVRRSWYDSGARLQHNDFHFFQPQRDGSFRLAVEEHVQRIWSVKDFDRASRLAGMERVGAWDDLMGPATARCERIHLVFRRPG